MRRRVFGIFGGLLLGVGVGVGGESNARVENILDRDYFSTVRRELMGAKSSVTVCLYLVTLRADQKSNVFQLMESLNTIHRTGVAVQVILDQNIDFSVGDGAGQAMIEGKNTPAYTYFKDRGIPVYFDDASTYTHSKVVVIDKETVILGSTNWTDSAMNRNKETNVLIRSKELARDILADLATIPRHEPMPESEEGVKIPGEFLTRDDLLGRMAKANDLRALDTWLYLVRQQSRTKPTAGDDINRPMTVNEDDLAVSLSISSMTRVNYRRQLFKVFSRLQNRYGLIQFKSVYNGDAQVILTPLEGERFAQLSHAYWNQGWNQRLSLAGKAFLLMGSYESAVSTQRPRWSVAQKTLFHRYHVSVGVQSAGITELRRKNLVEVDYAPVDTTSKQPRLPTIYTPNPFYNPQEMETAFDDLKKHGADKLARAQKAAALVYEDSDLNGIKELMALENQYGQESVEKALKLLGQKKPDNPNRSLAYLIGTIRKIK